jgi:hypothetical protein
MKELGCENRAPSLGFASPKDRRSVVGPTTRERIKGWLVARIRACSDRLFRDLDEQARQHGWNMETGPYGLSRSYRDPRFDALRAQPDLPPAGVGDAPERGQAPARQQGGCEHG